MPKSIICYPSKYYEAVIQLRPYDYAVYDFIADEVEKRKQRKELFISKIVEMKTGIDIYISSQQFARRLGDQLRRQFHAEVKITRTLHHQDRLSSRLLYRATVLCRLKPKPEVKETSKEED